MYAIVETGGFQYRVAPGTEIDVPRMDAPIGEKVVLERVLFLGEEGGERSVGRPTVESARAEAEVIAHGKGGKVLVQKFKRRKGYRRLVGHRTRYTRLRVHSIER